MSDVKTGAIQTFGGEGKGVDELCNDCHVKIKDQEDLFVGPDNRAPFCRACWIPRYKKGDCSKCKEPILGLECFDSPVCHTCSVSITNESVVALDHHYHVGCFKCVACAHLISGPFLSQNGEACCKSCIEKIKQKRPNYIAPAQPYLVNHPQDLQSEAVKKVTEGVAALPISTANCAFCKDPIVNVTGSPDNGKTLSTGKHIHSRCFNCSECKKPITEPKYMSSGDEFFHPDCRQSITLTRAGGDTLGCAECKKKISGGYMKFDGKSYHNACFKCSSCKKPVGETGYMETDEGLAVCEGCLEKQDLEKIPLDMRGAKTTVYAGLQTRDKKLPHTPNDNPATVGGRNICPRCKKEAYMSEQVSGPIATVWHKCDGCKKALDSNAKMHNELPYCVSCLGRAKK